VIGVLGAFCDGFQQAGASMPFMQMEEGWWVTHIVEENGKNENQLVAGDRTRSENNKTLQSQNRRKVRRRGDCWEEEQ
jgi:hypothetical protein